ncbi:MAG: hypothetical protein Q9185_002000 [Variospora sp. 1 TL-2023]
MPKEGRLETQPILASLRRSVALNRRHLLISRESIYSVRSTIMAPPARRRGPPMQWLPLYLDTNFQRLLRYETDRRFFSEFPSLSGNPQTQYQNPGQAVWGQSNQRIIQHTPVQRPQPHQLPPQQQPNAQQQQQHQQSSQAQEQSQQPREDLYPGTQFSGNNDDYRRGGQGGIGQLGASAQPQPNSIEEFPPLGRNGTDDNHDRRGSLIQSAAFGGFSNAFTLPSNQNQTRQGALVTPRANPPNNINSLLSSFQNHSIGSSSNSTHPQQPPSRQQPVFQASGASQTAENTPLDQMVPIDRWGLAGLLATIRSDNPDVAGLAIGQDLTQLGLDLNSQEPLWPTWSGPFAEPSARPLQPDFQLPECYTVDNVHRLRDKIPSFSDETLFWIFYTQPRDLMQELAASELTGRNWRYHKDLMMWLTKDTAFGEPVPLGDGTERGSYIFFNQRTWQRARSEFVLSYECLAPHSGASNGGSGGGGGGPGGSGAMMA